LFESSIERAWLEQGCKVGENVVPLARNFGGGMEVDIEADHLIKVIRDFLLTVFVNLGGALGTKVVGI
jgi:hypothetical protein